MLTRLNRPSHLTKNHLFILHYLHLRPSIRHGQCEHPAWSMKYSMRLLRQVPQKSISTMRRWLTPMHIPLQCIHFLSLHILLWNWHTLVLNLSQKANHIKKHWGKDLYGQAIKEAEGIMSFAHFPFTTSSAYISYSLKSDTMTSIPHMPAYQQHCVITKVLGQGSMSWCKSCQTMNPALGQAVMMMLEEVGKPQVIQKRQRSHGWRSLMVIFMTLKILGVSQLFDGGGWVQI